MSYVEKAIENHLRLPIFHTIGALADELELPCYVIGGYVRDILLCRPSKDIDVVVVGSGERIARALAKQLGKGATLSVFASYGTAQVKYPGGEIEFVGARRESYQRSSRNPHVESGTLEDDQRRRDFTVNALAICLNGERYGELIDPFGGIADIEECLLRTPLDPDITFDDDPLRMMRAIRFATQLHFTISPIAFEAIERNHERIAIIKGERIIDEINKIMATERPSRGFYLLDECGLLPLIFPELSALKGVESVGKMGHKDNFTHTLTVLDNVAAKSDNLWLRWAALLHDIAKPVTKRYDKRQGWTFHNHNFIGKKMIPAIFTRLKLPLKEKMRYVQKMVELHMRPIVLAEEEVTDSAIRRLLYDAGDDINDLMMLCECDITSKNETKVQRFLDNFALVRSKLAEIEEKDRIRNMRPLIPGEEVMRIFNLPPCAKVGEIQAAVKEAILEGNIPNEREAAFEYMLQYAASINLSPVEL